MKTAIAAFSKRGVELALKIAPVIGGEVWAPEKYVKDGVLPISGGLTGWTGQMFCRPALVFVSACGIAVRAVAPFVKSKTQDPAVVVLDERGRNVISLLSGHLGGANELAEKIAEVAGGRAIITTATDVGGLVAIDDWARKNRCDVENIAAAKDVSAEVLNSGRVGVAVTEELLSPPWPVTLWLRPKNLVIGTGCKKGADPDKMIENAECFLSESGVSDRSICAVASIEIKRGEPAINALAERYGVPFLTYSAEELERAEGTFAHSDRVKQETGVGNVCERAAVLASGGFLVRTKTIYKGMTFALAKKKNLAPMGEERR